MTAPAAPAEARQRRWFVLLLLLTALLRLLALSADPPASMPEAEPRDEGLWADAARGKLLFDDWYADDTGCAASIAPLHSRVLEVVFGTLGIGLWQARLPSALASVGLAWMLGLWIGRRAGFLVANAAVAALAVCPLLDQHAHMNLLESSQTFWITASFCLLFAAEPRSWRALLAGVCMGAAYCTKPNTLQYGVLPLALAFLDQWRRNRDGASTGYHRQQCTTAAVAAVGGVALLLAAALPIWAGHWPQLTGNAWHLSGNANWNLVDHLLHFGLVGSRETDPGLQHLWGLLRQADTICLGAWLWLLASATGRLSSRPGMRPALIWLLIDFVTSEISYQHVGRRQVLLLPPMAALLALLLADRPWQRPATMPVRRAWLWFLLTLPVVLLAKPALCNALAGQLPLPTVFARFAGAAGYQAGLLYFLPWLVVVLVPVWLQLDPRRLTGLVLASAPWLLLLAFASEVPRLCAVGPHQYTMIAAQQRLQPLVQAGEVVLGQNAPLLFMASPVRTVRRVVQEKDWATPLPNPDVFERLRPRYLVDYVRPEVQEMADLSRQGFRPLAAVEYMRETDGRFRYALQLWQRP